MWNEIPKHGKLGLVRKLRRAPVYSDLKMGWQVRVEDKGRGGPGLRGSVG